MTAEQVNRYLDLVNRRLYILAHSGADWKPEYETEMQQIDREIAEMQPIVEQARKEKEQRDMTAEKKERYRALLERRRRAFDAGGYTSATKIYRHYWNAADVHLTSFRRQTGRLCSFRRQSRSSTQRTGIRSRLW